MTIRTTYAGFWRRGAALLVDVALLLIVWGAIVAVTGGHLAGQLTVGFTIVYLVGLTMEGGTLGKRLLGLRVLRSDGQPVGLAHAGVRELVAKPVSLFALGLGFLWMLDEPQRQTWHDRLVDTVVVREQQVAVSPPWAAARRAAPPTGADALSA